MSDKKAWTQQIYKHKTKFQNPLHQNYKHVKTLQQLLDLNDQQIHSLVVFVGSSTFKTEMPKNVVKGRAFLNFIQSKVDIVFNEQEVRNLVLKVQEGRLEPSLKTHFEHVKNVKKIVHQKQSNEKVVQIPILTVLPKIVDSIVVDEVKRCPKCSSEMILRVTKNGEHAGKKFWGCSQYPKCRSVVNL